MQKNDKLFVAGAVLMAVLGGVWAHLLELTPAVDGMIDFFTAAAVLVGLSFVYLSRDNLGGETSENLTVLGVGLFVFVVSYWPSYVWSTAGNPAWFGLTTGFWNILFGMLNLVGFGIVAYGFYNFWDMGR